LRPRAGGFATVYRAQLRNPATGGASTVAVKVLRPAHLLRPMHLRRFLQEVAVQRSISHPNVVKVGQRPSAALIGAGTARPQLRAAHCCCEHTARAARRAPPGAATNRAATDCARRCWAAAC
jgi:hypothetical protein